MLATYHNHTSWSDGSASAADLVAAAARMGVGELGLSDHHVLHPSGRAPCWSMDPCRLGEYVAELRSLAGPMPLRVGLEVDWFPGHGAEIEGALRPHELDYVIGSVHEVLGVSVDGSARVWEELGPDAREAVHRAYWEALEGLACSGLFDIVAHLDLTKKFGFRPRSDLRIPVARALDAIAAAGLVVEVNTAGWHKPCAEAYPSSELLRECRRRGIEATISADAHEPAHLARDFPRAMGLLERAGFTRVARFAGRRVRFEPLAEACAPVASARSFHHAPDPPP